MSFSRYPKYKDSGVRWLGEVPVHWDVMKLKRIALLRSGETIAPDQIGDSGEFPVFGGNGLRGYTAAYTHEGDYALVGRQGALCGNINYASGKFWASEHAVVATPSDGVCTRWLGEMLRSMDLNQYSTSAAQPGLSVDVISNLVVAAPPGDEQQAIAAFLDRETARIDALIAEQAKLIALLKEKRQALISHAVTKGLDPNAPMKNSGIEWLGQVPAHWTLGGLTKFIGPVVDYRGRTPTKLDEGTFLVTAKNIRNGVIDYAASEEFVDPDEAAALLARGAPEIGDVLFTTEAPLGEVAQIDRTDIALAQRIVKFRGISDIIVNRYLMYWLMGSACQFRLATLATGSTALGIKASKLGMIECLVPPPDEQRAIVDRIDEGLRNLDALQVEAERAIELLKERRAALISAAVTGKIDVRDHADAPAEALV